MSQKLSQGEPPKPALMSLAALGDRRCSCTHPSPLPLQGSQRAQLEQSSAEAQPLECQGLRASNMQNKGFYWDFIAGALYRASAHLRLLRDACQAGGGLGNEGFKAESCSWFSKRKYPP